MRKSFFLLLLLSPSIAFARFAPDYGEAFVSCKLIKVTVTPAEVEREYDKDGNAISEKVITPAVETCLPDIPVVMTSYQAAVNGQTFIDGQMIPVEYEGMTAITHFTYRIADDAKVKELAGYLGKGAEVTRKPAYTAVWTQKMRDVMVMPQGTQGKFGEIEIIELSPEQEKVADDATAFSPFCAEGYSDN